jgi:hypothetical protein
MLQIVREVIVLGSLVVSVLAIRPNFHGFKPGGRLWIFKSDKSP